VTEDYLQFIRVPDDSRQYDDRWQDLTLGGYLLKSLAQILSRQSDLSSIDDCLEQLAAWKKIAADNPEDVDPESVVRALNLVRIARLIAEKPVNFFATFLALQNRMKQSGLEWEPWYWGAYGYLKAGKLFALKTITTDILLIDPYRADGIVASLTLQALPRGQGQIYKSPDSLFLECDNQFLKALSICRAYLCRQGYWKDNIDLQWSIRYHAGLRGIQGPSAGLSFTLAMMRLISEINTDNKSLARIRKLTVDPGVKYTAGIAEDGSLLPVGGVFAKLLGAAREKSLPRCHAVIVAESQQGIPPDLLEGTASLPHVKRLKNCEAVLDALEEIEKSSTGYWGEIRNYSQELNLHRNLVGREWLETRINQAVSRRSSGYILLNQGAGFGKTAMVCSLVRREGAVAAYHFLKQRRGDWDNPQIMLKSLSGQLRQHYALVCIPEEKRLARQGSFTAEFASVLQRVSQELDHISQEKAMIVIDGWDEAIETPQLSPKNALPFDLPEGIVILVTSRPGEHLSWLSDPAISQILDLSDAADRKSILKDVTVYLQRENAERSLGLKKTLINQMAKSTEGVFIAAVRFLLERDTLKADLADWQRNPDSIPRGLEGMLLREWDRLMQAGGKNLRQQTRALLGLLAYTAEGVSGEHLDNFFAFLSRRGSASEWTGIGPIRVEELWRCMEEVLAISAHCFLPVSGKADILQFFHLSFREYVRQQLTGVQSLDCQRLLSEACAGWKNYPEHIQEYCLKYRARHLLLSNQWEGLVKVLAESDYMVASIRHGGLPEVHAVLMEALESDKLPKDLRPGLEELERFLRWRINRLPEFPMAYPQEVVNELLPELDKRTKEIFQPLKEAFLKQPGLKLLKTSKTPAITVAKHTQHVQSVAFSPDGKYVTSGSWDNSVKVWEVLTGRLVSDCRGHTGSVLSVAFSPDGKYVGSGGGDATVKVFEAQTGKIIADCIGHQDIVTSVTFSPDGKYIYSASDDKTLKVWESLTGIMKCYGLGYQDKSDQLGAVAFFQDGSRIVTGSREGTVKVWESMSGRLISTWNTKTAPPNSVAFSPDGKYVVFSSKYGIYILDVLTGEVVHHRVVGDHQQNAAFSPDGHYILSGSFEGIVRIWEISSGKLVGKYQTNGDEADYWDDFHSLAFSNDGKYIATGSTLGAVRVYEVMTGHLVVECLGKGLYKEEIKAVSPSLKYIVTSVPHDKVSKVLEILTGKLIAEFEEIDSAIFSKDDKYIGTSRENGEIKIWETFTGYLIANCSGFVLAANDMVFSPDGKLFAALSTRDSIKIWETQNGQLVADCYGEEPFISEGVEFSPDGKYLISAGGDKTIIWEALNGCLVASRQVGGYIKSSTAISHNGQYVASRNRDSNTVEVWEATSGNLLIKRENSEEQPMNYLAFSPDDKYLLMGSFNGAAEIFEIQTGRLVFGQLLTKSIEFVSFVNQKWIVLGLLNGVVAFMDMEMNSIHTALFLSYRIEKIALTDAVNQLLVADEMGCFFNYDIIL